MTTCLKCQKETAWAYAATTYVGDTLCFTCSNDIACGKTQDANPIEELKNKATKAYHHLSIGLGCTFADTEEEEAALEVEALEELAAALLALAAAKKR